MGTGRQQHNDEPSEDGSLLGRDAFIESLAEQVAECRPPLVFGVHGEWGAGKTSVRRQLQRHLSDPELTSDGLRNERQNAARATKRPVPSSYAGRVFTIRFEAWRYQHDSANLRAALPTAAVREFLEGRSRNCWHDSGARTRRHGWWCSSTTSTAARPRRHTACSKA